MKVSFIRYFFSRIRKSELLHIVTFLVFIYFLEPTGKQEILVNYFQIAKLTKILFNK